MLADRIAKPFLWFVLLAALLAMAYWWPTDPARAIMAAANLPCTITDIPSSAYPTPAKRPHNSRLDTGKFQRTFELVLPDWTVGVERMLTEMLGK